MRSPLTIPLLCSLLAASLPAEADLSIRLSTAPRQGNIVAMLFDSADRFEDFSAPARIETVVADGRTALTLPAMPVGDYALVVFHDENGNGKLDFNFIGIPKEPIGFANQYRPKGPPSFTRALLPRDGGTGQPVDITLRKPLGDRGRLGVGIGILARSSPYARSTDNPVQFIPAISYIGNRLQIYGPYSQFGLAGSGNARLAASLAYRMAVYEADDSPVLRGMDDREATAMAGLRLQMDAPGGVDVNLGVSHDILDRLGGGEAQLGIARPLPWRSTRFTPSLAINWTSAEITRHDYGVTAQEATPQRPAYRPGDAFSIETGIGLFTELSPSVIAALRVSVEWLGDDVQRSPIVDDDHVIKSLAFINWLL